MSIENNLESIAKSLASIAKTLDHWQDFVVPDAVIEKEATKKPKSAAQAEAVVVQPVTAPTVEMPATPSFLSEPEKVVQGTTLSAIFKTHNEMTQYIMESYQSLGPTIGANIQGVLASIGAKTVNEIKPENYDALYAGVEALKP